VPKIHKCVSALTQELDNFEAKSTLGYVLKLHICQYWYSLINIVLVDKPRHSVYTSFYLQIRKYQKGRRPSQESPPKKPRKGFFCGLPRRQGGLFLGKLNDFSFEGGDSFGVIDR